MFRTQYVAIGSKESRMKSIQNIIPQGSVLGLILYTIYVNEISITSHVKTTFTGLQKTYSIMDARNVEISLDTWMTKPTYAQPREEKRIKRTSPTL